MRYQLRYIRLRHQGALVRSTGIGAVTSSVSGKRSPAELNALVQKLLMQFDASGTGIEPVCTLAGRCLTTRPFHRGVAASCDSLRSYTRWCLSEKIRADDGTRTRDPHLGKVMRYQLRYIRTALPLRLPGFRAPLAVREEH